MKKILFSLFAAAAATFGCNAQLLWEVSGNGIEKPSYLFGTHHLAPVSVIDETKGLKEAIASVDKVYGEMDMAKAQGPEAQQIMLAAAMAPQDSTLTAILSPAQLDSLDTILKKYMGPMASAAGFAQLKPAMISTIMALALNQQAVPNFNPQQPIDAEIQKIALQQGKEVDGFETIEDQCKALFGAPILTQAEGLMELVRDDSKAIELTAELAKAYLAGDLNKMFEVMESSSDSADAEWKERILDNRNANWMRIMAGMLPTASVLIAVGAGHLPGDKGLINLLRQNGFTVKPVK